jgi:hypothetical protein
MDQMNPWAQLFAVQQQVFFTYYLLRKMQTNRIREREAVSYGVHISRANSNCKK